MEEKNQDQKKLFQAMDASAGSFIITDTGGKIVYANKKIEDRSGFSVAEVVGKRPGELWGGNMERGFYDRMWRAIRDERRPFMAHVQNTKKSGQIAEEELHIAPVAGERGTADFFVEVQPAGADRPDKFMREFHILFSGAVISARELRDKLVEWFDISEQVMSEAVNSGSSRSAVSFLKTLFVAPLSHTFSARQEDAALILAAQKDPREFTHLYAKYYDSVYNYFAGHMGRTATAEDLAQDTFYKALKYISLFTISNASYKTYLLRMAHNALVNFYRKKRAISIDEEMEQMLGVEPEYEDRLVADALWNSMGALSENEYRAVVMKYKEGLSVREIALVLGKTENAIKLYLSRARAKIRGEVFGK